MNSFLRKLRIVVSLFFLLITTFLFVDIFNLVTPLISNKITFLQFVPSLLKFIAIISISSFGFIIVFILTFLFGRIYCSTICPLGTFQDLVNYFSKKINKKKRNKNLFLKEIKWLRLLILFLAIITFAFGFILIVNLFDPYSIYGRISGNFFKPVLVFINNLLAFILEQFRIFWISPYDIKAFNFIPFLISLSFLILVLVLAWKKGRLYCNTVCPVGTLLGYLSKISFYKIRIKEEDCLSCGACARDCKANCIDSLNKKIDETRCVVCFDCLTSCPTEGITFSFNKKEEIKNESFNNDKRNFFVKTSIFLLTLTNLAAQVEKKIKITKPSKIPIFRKNAISPPGSISLEYFNSKCTACHLCVSSCPTQVLQPSFLEYGFTGMLQPRLDNNAGFCNFECNICSEVCPTGAILPIKLEEKKLSQLGIAKFIKENCVVHTQKTECGACSEHCPTKAVHMIPYEGTLVIPEVREKYCIGCGACEFACPVIPYKAIYVEGNEIHKKAEINNELKIEQKVDLKEDFPF
ncbi:MAG: 4Fe-4S binding protein [Melioribacteraceae bacterium]|nr:4Fe-4S binding protein [Melioribacteraceae bacterium]